MAVYKLARTGLPDLEFTGEQLIELQGTDPDGCAAGRWTSVVLYKAEDGQFIVAIHYETPSAAEGCDNCVEAADSIEDVDAILSSYNPADRLDKKQFNDSSRTTYSAVSGKLTRRYDEQVGTVLASLEAAYADTSEPS